MGKIGTNTESWAFFKDLKSWHLFSQRLEYLPKSKSLQKNQNENICYLQWIIQTFRILLHRFCCSKL